MVSAATPKRSASSRRTMTLSRPSGAGRAARCPAWPALPAPAPPAPPSSPRDRRRSSPSTARAPPRPPPPPPPPWRAAPARRAPGCPARAGSRETRRPARAARPASPARRSPSRRARSATSARVFARQRRVPRLAGRWNSESSCNATSRMARRRPDVTMAGLRMPSPDRRRCFVVTIAGVLASRDAAPRRAPREGRASANRDARSRP